MKVLLSAGEPSGDRYAAAIARELHRLRPGVEIKGMGSHHLLRAGAELVVDSTNLAVTGLAEVLSHVPELLRARRALRRCLRDWRPDVFVPVDYPDFNLRLARWAKSHGTRVAYFVSPQVWAWRPYRVPGIGRAVSRMLVIFPFEVDLYHRHGVSVRHVGHPLLDLHEPLPSRLEAREQLGIAPGALVLAVLPGSRANEVRQTWPVLLETARLLRAERPFLELAVALAPGIDEARLRAVEEPAGFDVRFAEGLRLPLAACDAAFVASGTATLEAGLCERAFVTGYRVHPASIAVGRWLADRRFLARGSFALPNLVLGRNVVPELYQERFTPPRLAEELGALLDDPRLREAMISELAGLEERLGGTGTFERVAGEIVELADATLPQEERGEGAG